MLIIHKKKFFRFYKYNSSRPKEECLKFVLDDNDFVIQMTTQTGRYYTRFICINSFYSWFIKIPPRERTFSEVIKNGKQKLKIDIDERVDNIERIIDIIKSMLNKIGIHNPILLLYDIKTSYHIVLTNYYFLNNENCKVIAQYLENFLKIKIDLGVYGKIQHFRLEECTKFGELRWKKRHSFHKKMDNNNFHEGVISSIKNAIPFTKMLPSLEKKTINNFTNIDMVIDNNFKVRERRGAMIILDRVYPSYCQICKRIHESDGGYIIGNKFYCYRNNDK